MDSIGLSILLASKLDSPKECRLLLCDGHGSEISVELIDSCINHRITLILVPPDSSHLLQPLDGFLFASLKKNALRSLISPFPKQTTKD